MHDILSDFSLAGSKLNTQPTLSPENTETPQQLYEKLSTSLETEKPTINAIRQNMLSLMKSTWLYTATTTEKITLIQQVNTKVESILKEEHLFDELLLDRFIDAITKNYDELPEQLTGVLAQTQDLMKLIKHHTPQTLEKLKQEIEEKIKLSDGLIDKRNFQTGEYKNSFIQNPSSTYLLNLCEEAYAFQFNPTEPIERISDILVRFQVFLKEAQLLSVEIPREVRKILDRIVNELKSEKSKGENERTQRCDLLMNHLFAVLDGTPIPELSVPVQS